MALLLKKILWHSEEKVHIPSYLKFLSTLPCSKEIKPNFEKEYERIANIPVSEIMNTNIIKVMPKTEIKNLINIIIKNQIHTVPVVDDKNNIQGIVSIKDIIKLLQDPKKIIKEFEKL